MSKRARYDGPQAVTVRWPPGEAYGDEEIAVVEPGHMLPADAPAALRDELLKREDWSEVQDASSSSSATTKKES